MKRTIKPLLIVVLLLFVSSCEVLNDVGKRSVVTMPLNNQENCTWAEVRDANGDFLGKIAPHKLGTVQAHRKIFFYDDPQDETFVGFQTPDSVIREILNGNADSVIPQGCDNWGYGDEEIDLDGGYETHLEDIDLRPPDYWREPDHWKRLSQATQIKIINDVPGFWQRLPIEIQKDVQNKISYFEPPKIEETRFYSGSKFELE